MMRPRRKKEQGEKRKEGKDVPTVFVERWREKKRETERARG